MQIKDYFRAFTEDELARGAELFFSGDLEDITKKAQNTLRYLKEKEDSEKATGPAVYQRYPQKGTAHYTAKWNEQGSVKKMWSIPVSLGFMKRAERYARQNAIADTSLQTGTDALMLPGF